MTYVEPTTRGDQFVVSHTVWNQDVVENFKALKALTEVEPSIMVEKTVGQQAFSSSVWTTRKISDVLRDPDGIILNEDLVNFQWDLADGDYQVEIMTYALVQHNQWFTSRLRDIDNSTTLTGTASFYPITQSGWSNGEQVIHNHTFSRFSLANVSDTTVELQSYTNGSNSTTRGNTASEDADNLDLRGIYESIVKLWKIG
jgi:hypothetical protein